EASLDPFEQGEPQPLLGVREQAADRGLRDEQQFGGAADRTGGHDSAKDFDLPEIQLHDGWASLGRMLHNKGLRVSHKSTILAYRPARLDCLPYAMRPRG